MARSATLQGSYGGDPLRNMERNRAAEAREIVSRRDRAAWGNAPIPEQPRRMTKTLEEFVSSESSPNEWSEARKALEALFSKPQCSEA